MNSTAVMTDGTKVKHEKDGGQNVLPQVGGGKKKKEGGGKERKGKCFPLSHSGWSNWNSKLTFGYTENVKTVASNPNTDPVII